MLLQLAPTAARVWLGAREAEAGAHSRDAVAGH